MRVRIALAALLAAIPAALVATPGANAREGSCGPSKATTLAADKVARVYSTHQRVYGCIYGSRSTYKLGTTTNSMGEGRVGPIALAGVNVGFGRTTYGVDVISAEVVVERLTDGVVLRDRSATTANVGPEYSQRVHSVVLKPDDSVAWIASISSKISQRNVIQVRKSDQSARTSLDSGPRIRPGSLRLHGSTLSWRDGSAKKTARLR